MSPNQLAQLTLEVWRASGLRTESRRDALLTTYAESYYGNESRWPEEIRSLVSAAHLITRQRTRIDELKYT